MAILGVERAGYSRVAPTARPPVSGSEANVGSIEPRKPKKFPVRGVIYTLGAITAGLELAKAKWGTFAPSDAGIALLDFVGGNSGNPTQDQIDRMDDIYRQVHNLPTPTGK